MFELIRAIGLTILFAIPLGLSIWALLDAAGRPAWVWALAERRQVAWIGGVAIGVLILPLGLTLSIVYLTKVRPRLVAIEGGDVS